MIPDIIIPIMGASTMKYTVGIILAMFNPYTVPALAIPAPANPPISVCEELDGIPFHQVRRFQIIAAMRPEKTTGSVMNSGFTVLATVSATLSSNIQYATKLKNAAQSTAWNGVSTLVETT